MNGSPSGQPFTEQTAQLLSTVLRVWFGGQIRHAKNPTVIRPPDEDEQKILSELNTEPISCAVCNGGDPVHKRRGARPTSARSFVSGSSADCSVRDRSSTKGGIIIAEIL